MEENSELSANAAIASSVAGVLAAPFQESPLWISTTILSTCTVTQIFPYVILLHSHNLDCLTPTFRHLQHAE